MQRDTQHLSESGPTAGQYGSEKLQIWTLSRSVIVNWQNKIYDVLYYFKFWYIQLKGTKCFWNIYEIFKKCFKIFMGAGGWELNNLKTQKYSKENVDIWEDIFELSL